MQSWFIDLYSICHWFAGNDVSILGICSICGKWECSGWSVPIHFGRWWRRGRGFGQHDYHHGHFLFNRFHPFSQRSLQEKLKILSIFCWFSMLILIDALIKSSFCFRMMIGCVLRDKMLRFDLRSFRTHLPEWSIIDWHERKKKRLFFWHLVTDVMPSYSWKCTNMTRSRIIKNSKMFLPWIILF